MRSRTTRRPLRIERMLGADKEQAPLENWCRCMIEIGIGVPVPVSSEQAPLENAHANKEMQYNSYRSMLLGYLETFDNAHANKYNRT